jgi:hypothetical protein
MPKQLVPFKAEEEFMALVDKLILISQFGWTRKRYESRTSFILQSITRSAKELLTELQNDQEVSLILPKVLGEYDPGLLEDETHDSHS